MAVTVDINFRSNFNTDEIEKASTFISKARADAVGLKKELSESMQGLSAPAALLSEQLDRFITTTDQFAERADEAKKSFLFDGEKENASGTAGRLQDIFEDVKAMRAMLFDSNDASIGMAKQMFQGLPEAIQTEFNHISPRIVSALRSSFSSLNLKNGIQSRDMSGMVLEALKLPEVESLLGQTHASVDQKAGLIRALIPNALSIQRTKEYQQLRFGQDLGKISAPKHVEDILPRSFKGAYNRFESEPWSFLDQMTEEQRRQHLDARSTERLVQMIAKNPVALRAAETSGLMRRDKEGILTLDQNITGKSLGSFGNTLWGEFEKRTKGLYEQLEDYYGFSSSVEQRAKTEKKILDRAFSGTSGTTLAAMQEFDAIFGNAKFGRGTNDGVLRKIPAVDESRRLMEQYRVWKESPFLPGDQNALRKQVPIMESQMTRILGMQGHDYEDMNSVKIISLAGYDENNPKHVKMLQDLKENGSTDENGHYVFHTIHGTGRDATIRMIRESDMLAADERYKSFAKKNGFVESNGQGASVFNAFVPMNYKFTTRADLGKHIESLNKMWTPSYLYGSNIGNKQFAFVDFSKAGKEFSNGLSYLGNGIGASEFQSRFGLSGKGSFVGMGFNTVGEWGRSIGIADDAGRVFLPGKDGTLFDATDYHALIDISTMKNMKAYAGMDNLTANKALTETVKEFPIGVSRDYKLDDAAGGLGPQMTTFLALSPQIQMHQARRLGNRMMELETLTGQRKYVFNSPETDVVARMANDPESGDQFILTSPQAARHVDTYRESLIQDALSGAFINYHDIADIQNERLLRSPAAAYFMTQGGLTDDQVKHYQDIFKEVHGREFSPDEIKKYMLLEGGVADFAHINADKVAALRSPTGFGQMIVRDNYASILKPVYEKLGKKEWTRGFHGNEDDYKILAGADMDADMVKAVANKANEDGVDMISELLDVQKRIESFNISDDEAKIRTSSMPDLPGGNDMSNVKNWLAYAALSVKAPLSMGLYSDAGSRLAGALDLTDVTMRNAAVIAAKANNGYDPATTLPKKPVEILRDSAIFQALSLGQEYSKIPAHLNDMYNVLAQEKEDENGNVVTYYTTKDKKTEIPSSQIFKGSSGRLMNLAYLSGEDGTRLDKTNLPSVHSSSALGAMLSSKILYSHGYVDSTLMNDLMEAFGVKEGGEGTPIGFNGAGPATQRLMANKRAMLAQHYGMQRFSISSEERDVLASQYAESMQEIEQKALLDMREHGQNGRIEGVNGKLVDFEGYKNQLVQQWGLNTVAQILGTYSGLKGVQVNTGMTPENIQAKYGTSMAGALRNPDGVQLPHMEQGRFSSRYEPFASYQTLGDNQLHFVQGGEPAQTLPVKNNPNETKEKSKEEQRKEEAGSNTSSKSELAEGEHFLIRNLRSNVETYKALLEKGIKPEWAKERYEEAKTDLEKAESTGAPSAYAAGYEEGLFRRAEMDRKYPSSSLPSSQATLPSSQGSGSTVDSTSLFQALTKNDKSKIDEMLRGQSAIEAWSKIVDESKDFTSNMYGEVNKAKDRTNSKKWYDSNLYVLQGLEKAKSEAMKRNPNGSFDADNELVAQAEKEIQVAEAAFSKGRTAHITNTIQRELDGIQKDVYGETDADKQAAVIDRMYGRVKTLEDEKEGYIKSEALYSDLDENGSSNRNFEIQRLDEAIEKAKEQAKAGTDRFLDQNVEMFEEIGSQFNLIVSGKDKTTDAKIKAQVTKTKKGLIDYGEKLDQYHEKNLLSDDDYNRLKDEQEDLLARVYDGRYEREISRAEKRKEKIKSEKNIIGSKKNAVSLMSEATGTPLTAEQYANLQATELRSRIKTRRFELGDLLKDSNLTEGERAAYESELTALKGIDLRSVYGQFLGSAKANETIRNIKQTKTTESLDRLFSGSAPLSLNELISDATQNAQLQVENAIKTLGLNNKQAKAFRLKYGDKSRIEQNIRDQYDLQQQEESYQNLQTSIGLGELFTGTKATPEMKADLAVEKARLDISKYYKSLQRQAKRKGLSEEERQSILSEAERWNPETYDFSGYRSMIFSQEDARAREIKFQRERQLSQIDYQNNAAQERRDYNYGRMNRNRYFTQGRLASYYYQGQDQAFNLKQTINDNNFKASQTRKQIDEWQNELKSGAKGVRKDQLEANIKAGEFSLKGYTSAAADAEKELSKFGSAQNAVASVTKSLSDSLSRLATRLGRRLFQKAIQEAKQFVQQFDQSMTQIQMITLKTDEEMDSIGDGLIAKAKELKTTVSQITSIATDLYRQGLSDEEMNERLDTVAKFSMVSGTKATDATKLITTAINTGLVDDASVAADIVTALGDSAATNAAQIEKGIEKAGAAAATDGTSFAELTALLTAVTATTQVSGSVAGTALNSIFGRMNKVGTNELIFDENGNATSGSDIATLLRARGIATNNSDGSRRSTFSMLYDLAQQYETMSDDEQRQISTAISGTRQYSNFSAIMTGIREGDIDKYLELAQGAEGTVDKKYEVYTKSLQASLNELKTTWDEVVNDLVDKGYVQDFISGMTTMVKGVGNLVESLGGLKASLPVVMALVGALTGLKFGGIGAAVGLVAGLATYGITTAAGSQEEKKTASQKYTETAKEIKTASTERQDDITKFKNLSNKESLTKEEKAEYGYLADSLAAYAGLDEGATEAAKAVSVLSDGTFKLSDAAKEAAKNIADQADAETENKKYRDFYNKGIVDSAAKIAEEADAGVREYNSGEGSYSRLKSMADEFAASHNIGEYEFSEKGLAGVIQEASRLTVGGMRPDAINLIDEFAKFMADNSAYNRDLPKEARGKDAEFWKKQLLNSSTTEDLLGWWRATLFGGVGGVGSIGTGNMQTMLDDALRIEENAATSGYETQRSGIVSAVTSVLKDVGVEEDYIPSIAEGIASDYYEDQKILDLKEEGGNVWPAVQADVLEQLLSTVFGEANNPTGDAEIAKAAYKNYAAEHGYTSKVVALEKAGLEDVGENGYYLDKDGNRVELEDAIRQVNEYNESIAPKYKYSGKTYDSKEAADAQKEIDKQEDFAKQIGADNLTLEPMQKYGGRYYYPTENKIDDAISENIDRNAAGAVYQVPAYQNKYTNEIYEAQDLFDTVSANTSVYRFVDPSYLENRFFADEADLNKYIDEIYYDYNEFERFGGQAYQDAAAAFTSLYKTDPEAANEEIRKAYENWVTSNGGLSREEFGRINTKTYHGDEIQNVLPELESYEVQDYNNLINKQIDSYYEPYYQAVKAIDTEKYGDKIYSDVEKFVEENLDAFMEEEWAKVELEAGDGSRSIWINPSTGKEEFFDSYEEAKQRITEYITDLYSSAEKAVEIEQPEGIEKPEFTPVKNYFGSGLTSGIKEKRDANQYGSTADQFLRAIYSEGITTVGQLAAYVNGSDEVGGRFRILTENKDFASLIGRYVSGTGQVLDSNASLDDVITFLRKNGLDYGEENLTNQQIGTRAAESYANLTSGNYYVSEEAARQAAEAAYNNQRASLSEEFKKSEAGRKLHGDAYTSAENNYINERMSPSLESYLASRYDDYRSLDENDRSYMEQVFGKDLTSRILLSNSTGATLSAEDQKLADRLINNAKYGNFGLTASDKLAGMKEIQARINGEGITGYSSVAADQYMSGFSGWTEYKQLKERQEGGETLSAEDLALLSAYNVQLDQFVKNSSINLKITGLSDMEAAGQLIEGTASAVQKLMSGGWQTQQAVSTMTQSIYTEGQQLAALYNGTEEQQVRELVRSGYAANETQARENLPELRAQAISDFEAREEATGASYVKNIEAVEDAAQRQRLIDAYSGMGWTYSNKGYNEYKNRLLAKGLTVDENGNVYNQAGNLNSLATQKLASYSGTMSFDSSGLTYDQDKDYTKFYTQQQSADLARRAINLGNYNDVKAQFSDQEMTALSSFSSDLVDWLRMDENQRTGAEGQAKKQAFEIAIKTTGLSTLEEAGELLEGTSKLISDLQKNGTISLKAELDFENNLYTDQQNHNKLVNGSYDEQVEAMRALGVSDNLISSDFTRAREMAMRLDRDKQQQTAATLNEIRKTDTPYAQEQAEKYGYEYVPNETELQRIAAEASAAGLHYDVKTGKYRDSAGRVNEELSARFNNVSSGYTYVGGNEEIDYVNPGAGVKQTYTGEQIVAAQQTLLRGGKITDSNLLTQATGEMGEQLGELLRMRYMNEITPGIYSADQIEKQRQKADNELTKKREEATKQDRLKELEVNAVDLGGSIAYAREQYRQNNETGFAANDVFRKLSKVESAEDLKAVMSNPAILSSLKTMISSSPELANKFDKLGLSYDSESQTWDTSALVDTTGDLNTAFYGLIAAVAETSEEFNGYKPVYNTGEEYELAKQYLSGEATDREAQGEIFSNLMGNDKVAQVLKNTYSEIPEGGRVENGTILDAQNQGVGRWDPFAEYSQADQDYVNRYFQGLQFGAGGLTDIERYAGLMDVVSAARAGNLTGFYNSDTFGAYKDYTSNISELDMSKWLSAQMELESVGSSMFNLDGVTEGTANFEKINAIVEKYYGSLKNAQTEQGKFNSKIKNEGTKVMNSYGDSTQKVIDRINQLNGTDEERQTANKEMAQNRTRMGYATYYTEGKGKNLSAQKKATEYLGWSKDDYMSVGATEAQRKMVVEQEVELQAKIDEENFMADLNAQLANFTSQFDNFDVGELNFLVGGTYDISKLQEVLEGDLTDAARATIEYVISLLNGMEGEVTFSADSEGNTVKVHSAGSGVRSTGGGTRNTGSSSGGSGNNNNTTDTTADDLITGQNYYINRRKHFVTMSNAKRSYAERTNNYQEQIDAVAEEIGYNNALVKQYKTNNEELKKKRDAATKGSEDWYKYQAQIDSNNEEIAKLQTTNDELQGEKLTITQNKQANEEKDTHHAGDMLSLKASNYLEKGQFENYRATQANVIKNYYDDIAQNNSEISELEDLLEIYDEGGKNWIETRDAIWEKKKENAELENTALQAEHELNQAIISQIATDLQTALAPSEHEINMNSTWGSIYKLNDQHAEYRSTLSSQNEMYKVKQSQYQTALQQAQDELDRIDPEEDLEGWKAARAAVYEYEEALASCTLAIAENDAALEESYVTELTDDYNDAMSDIDHEINMAKYTAEGYKQDNDYTNYLNVLSVEAEKTAEKIDLAKASLSSMEAKLNDGTIQEGSKQWETLKDQIKSVRENIASTENTYDSLQDSIKQGKYDSIMDTFNDQNDLSQHQIKMLQYQETRYQNAGELTNYGTTLGYENEEQKRRKTLLQGQLAEMKSLLINDLDPSDSMYDTVTKQVYSLEEQIASLDNTIEKNEDTLKKNAENIRKVYKTLENEIEKEIKARIKLEEDMLAGTVSVQNSIYDLIKTRYTDEWAQRSGPYQSNCWNPLKPIYYNIA